MMLTLVVCSTQGQEGEEDGPGIEMIPGFFQETKGLLRLQIQICAGEGRDEARIFNGIHAERMI